MDFELSSEQVALSDAARSLLDRQASAERVRAVVDLGGGWDRELWRAMVDQGWTGAAVPESHGGLGLGWVELAVLLEALGAHVAPAPFLPQVVALDVLVRAGASNEWIEPLVSGDAVAAVAWSADRLPVLYAPSADVVVGTVGDALVGVDLRDDAVMGMRPKAEPAMDRTREVGWLSARELVDHAVAAGAPVLRLGDSGAVDAFIARGAVAHAAEMLGGAAHLLEITVAYARDREQFGKPIGSFQAVKHRCADMLVDVEGMRSAVWWAAWCVGADDPDALVAASTAKVWCSDAARRVAASALQVHGGIGFTWEHELHLFLKRAQLDEVSFGDATWHRSRLADLLRGRLNEGGSVI